VKPDPAGATSSTISLREYLEAKIEGEREINRNFRAAAKEEFFAFRENLTKETDDARLTIAEKMEVLNELRRAVETDRSLFIRVDKYDADMKARDAKIEALGQLIGSRIDPIEKWQAGIVAAGLPAEVASQAQRIKAQEDWRNKLLGIGVMIVLFGGLVGALLMRLLSGVFGK
jgi:hypothetical protein